MMMTTAQTGSDVRQNGRTIRESHGVRIIDVIVDGAKSKLFGGREML